MTINGENQPNPPSGEDDADGATGERASAVGTAADKAAEASPGTDEDTPAAGAAAHPAGSAEDGEAGRETPEGGKGGKGGEGGERGEGGGWRAAVAYTAGGVLVALLLHFFVIASFWIPSESMENTLIEHDRVIVNRLSGSPDRGDVVVFNGWDGTPWIKRVIGIPGDTVECCDSKHRLSVNGTPLDETYLYPGNYASGDGFKVTVPKGRLWVMGDHRVASRDSRSQIHDRFHGTISEDDVIGRAFAIYWPLSRATFLTTPEAFARVH
jgi:signal peptidase I